MTSFLCILGERDRGRDSPVSPFIRTLSLLDQGPTLMNSFSPNCLHKGPICKYRYIGIRTSTLEFFRGGHNSVYSTECLFTPKCPLFIVCRTMNLGIYQNWMLITYQLNDLGDVS